MTPCAVVSAARLDGLVLRRTEFQQHREPVRVRLGYLPAPSVPPNRNVIVRAHQPTGYPRLRAVEREKDRAPFRRWHFFFPFLYGPSALSRSGNMGQRPNLSKGGRGDSLFSFAFFFGGWS